jgi:hypothetical protein
LTRRRDDFSFSDVQGDEQSSTFFSCRARVVRIVLPASRFVTQRSHKSRNAHAVRKNMDVLFLSLLETNQTASMVKTIDTLGRDAMQKNTKIWAGKALAGNCALRLKAF